MQEGDLEALYSQRFAEGERAAREALWETLCRSWFDRWIPAAAAVLDVGAGRCEFINHVRATRRIAIDLNPGAKHFAGEGVEFHAGSLLDVAVLVSEPVDVAFASNVFEHLRSPDELLRVLRGIRSVLKPGGVLLVMQPNARLVGMRFYDFFDHTLPLTETGMREALQVAGFRVEHVTPRFLPYTTKSRLPLWPWLVRLYLALAPARWIFGKQMFVVARRA